MGWGRDSLLLASFAIALAAWLPPSRSQQQPGHLQGPPLSGISQGTGHAGTLAASNGCGLAEFACDRGNCISTSRFCDGTDDCGDNSDEPFGCTNCNRTLYGEMNQKYPLRLTEPFQRYSPFICNINFVAAGGDYGDIVELTFLSFQTGTLEVGRNQTMVCQKGYLQLTESAGPTDSLRSQQTRGLTQLISAMGGPPSDHNLFERRQEPHFGQFCGEMIGRSAAFYSDSGNVTLVVVIPSRASILTYSFSLYLTYKFIRRPVIPVRSEPDSEPDSSDDVDIPVEHYGTRLTHTYCDRVMVDCDRKRCKIRSPNFPGFYLRNITCRFHVKQESVPRGKKAQVILQQTNEYKVSIFTGRTTSGTLSHRILTSDCQGDTVRVYDGNTTSSPLLVSFCGSGPLPAIVTSGPEVLVELYSAPYQFIHNSRVEIDVRVRFVESSDLRMERGRCEFVLDGNLKREGIIHSPTHTVPPNTTCVYTLKGRDAYDRVWVYFLSYFVEDRHLWTNIEKCDVSRLEIDDTPRASQSSSFIFNQQLNPYQQQLRSPSSGGIQSGGGSQGANSSDEFAYSFCEKQSPKICARAADTDGYVPRAKPCQVGTESYLSAGSDMVIRQTYFKTQELPTRQSNFVARYEFVDTHLDGIPVGPQESKGCDRVFHSSTHPEGELKSPRNLFLYGRGGRENLTCAYHFVGRAGERVKLEITRFRLISPSCRHFFDDVTSRNRCHFKSKNGKAATLQATEHWSNFSTSIGCLCNSSFEDADGGSTAFFESVSSNVVLQFSASYMSAVEDFHHFWFEARFEFINHSLCDTIIQRRNGSEGELTFQTPVNAVQPGDGPLRCRWLLEANKGKYLYLKFRGSNSYSECSTGNRFVVYTGASGPLQAISAVCVQEGQSAQKFDIFSVSWYNDTSVKGTSGVDDKLFVEAIAQRPGLFAVKWLEVTKPFLRTQSGKMLRNVNCLHECPELSACISPELWCDGTVHCPSGFDEAREHCEKFPTFYVTIGGGAALLVVVVILMGVFIRRCGRKRKKKNGKANRPTITDDLQLESARF